MKNTDEVRIQAIAAMQNFSNERRQEWWIWAARGESCPKCHMPPFEACVNLLDRRKHDKDPSVTVRRTRWPHTERINSYKLLEGLKQRGYYTG